jgi:proteasome accessory factor C
MLDLVPFLISHQGISLADLAAHFKVDNDVIIDDLNTLWMCGLPGYTPLELIDLAFDSGYVTIRNAAPLAYIRTMSSTEIVSLALGLDLLRETTEKLSADQSERIEKLSQRLRDQVGGQITIASSSHTTSRSLIARSITQRVPVKMTYYSAHSDDQSERLVTAYDFFHEDDVEYFRGYCHSTQGMRTFRVDRIVAASFADVAVVTPARQPHQQEKIRVGGTVRALDRTSAEAFRLDFAELEVGSSVTLEAFSPEWLVRAIMAGAASLVVEEPSEFRLLVRQSVEATMALYE